MGVWRGPVAGRRQNRGVQEEGPLLGPGSAKQRKSLRVSGSRQRRGVGEPAWRHFRSLGSERQAVLGSSLEPVISQPRVTWMPGIPEPLGCSTLGRPPSASSLHSPAPFTWPFPARCCFGRRESGHKGRLECAGGGGRGSISQGERASPCSLHSWFCLPSPPLFPPAPPQASSTQKIPSQTGRPMAGDGQGLRTPNPC